MYKRANIYSLTEALIRLSQGESFYIGDDRVYIDCFSFMKGTKEVGLSYIEENYEFFTSKMEWWSQPLPLKGLLCQVVGTNSFVLITQLFKDLNGNPTSALVANGLEGYSLDSLIPINNTDERLYNEFRNW